VLTARANRDTLLTMKLNVFSTLCCLLAVLAPVRAGGRLVVVGSDTVDFGRHPADQNTVAEFTLRNDGDAPVDILRVRTDCGCSAAEIGARVIAPGETSPVKLTVRPNALGGVYRKSAFVESNDPENRVIKLSVVGDAVQRIVVKPSMYVDVGDLSTASDWRGSVDLVSEEEDVLLGEPVVDGLVTIETKLERVTAERGSHYRMGITVTPPDRIGSFHGVVNVPLLGPEGAPARVLVSGRVGTELVIIPAVAYLQRSDQPQVRRFTLRLADSRAQPMKADVLEISEHPGVSASVSPNDDGKSLVLMLTFETEFLKAFDQKKEIPVYFRVPDASGATLRCRLH